MTEKELNFNDLPKAIGEIYSIVANIQSMLGDNSREGGNQDDDNWLNIDQLCAYHPNNPAKQTVYGWISDKKIPYNKNGKMVCFLKSEIDEWLRQGRRKTVDEIDLQAREYINNKKNYKF